MYFVDSVLVDSVHYVHSAHFVEFVLVVAFVLVHAVEFGVALLSSLNFLVHCVPEELTFGHYCYQKGWRRNSFFCFLIKCLICQ